MATYEVTDKQGHVYEVTAPDHMSMDQVRDYVKQKMAEPDAPPVITDVAKSIVSAPRDLAVNVLGAPGAVERLGHAIGSELGATKDVPLVFPEASQVDADLPLQYESKTTPGKYAREIAGYGLMAPFGEGQALPKAVEAITGGMGAETAREMTEGTELEPYAEAAGGLVGGNVPKVAKKLRTPYPIDPKRAKAVEALRREGVEPLAGDVSGSKLIQRLEKGLGELPFAGGAYEKARSKVSEQYTAAALRRAGIDANYAEPHEIQAADAQIGGEMDAMALNNIAPYDDPFQRSIDKARNDYDYLFLDPLKAPMVRNVDGMIRNAIYSRAHLTGEEYQAWRTKLRRMQKGTQDQGLKDYLGDVRQAVDDLMERGIARLNPQDAGEWKRLNRLYKNLMVIEDVSIGGGEEAAKGVISPQRLRQAAVKRGKAAYAKGEGDFAELSRAGNEIISSRGGGELGARTKIYDIIPTGVGAMLGALSGEPTGAAIGAMAGLSGPGLSGKALLSKRVQDYLKNQKMAGVKLSPEDMIILRALASGQGHGQLSPQAEDALQ